MIGTIVGGHRFSGANPIELSDIMRLECTEGRQSCHVQCSFGFGGPQAFTASATTD
jgi:hypothetical protein